MRKSRLHPIITGALLLIPGAGARAESRPPSFLPLVSQVRVSAEMSPANLSRQATPDSLLARIMRRLEAAGLRVRTGPAADSEAVLEVRIGFARLTAAPLSGDLVGYGFAVNVALTRQVRTIATAAAASRAIPASIWESWSIGGDDPILAPVQAMRAAEAKVDEFTKDWAAARGGVER